MQKLLSEFNLEVVETHGCQLGVWSLKHEKPIKKPWKIATNSQFVAETLATKRCTHSPEEHAPCAGSETNKTGFYPAKMARVILRALEKEAAGMDGKTVFAMTKDERDAFEKTIHPRPETSSSSGSEDTSKHWPQKRGRASQTT